MAKERDHTLDEFREHSLAAVEAWSEGWQSLIPEKFHTFMDKGRQGRKEALLAARSLLDVAIDRLEGKDSPKAKSKKKVKVEVE